MTLLQLGLFATSGCQASCRSTKILSSIRAATHPSFLTDHLLFLRSRATCMSLRWLCCRLASGSCAVDSAVSSSHQVFTGEDPFDVFMQYWEVREAIMAGIRPNRPGPEATERGLSDEVWALMQDCWAQDPRLRPGMEEVLTRMQKAESGWKPSTEPCVYSDSEMQRIECGLQIG